MLLKKSIAVVMTVSFLATTAAANHTDTNSVVAIKEEPVAEQAQQKQIFIPAIIPARAKTQAIRLRFVVDNSSAITEETKEEPTPVIVPDNLKCPEYYALAKELGWPEDQLERLDHVMWRESRCDSSVHNTKDPASGSRGLIQINGFWCRPNRWTKNGYLQDHNILKTCEDLFDPAVNLRAGLSIYNYGLETHRCGWGPWSTKNL